MAITNAEAVKFSNENVRAMADRLGGAYTACKTFLDCWVAKDMATLFPDDAAEVLADGAGADGRTSINGADVRRLKDACQAIVDDYEAVSNKRKNEILKVSVQPR